MREILPHYSGVYFIFKITKRIFSFLNLRSKNSKNFFGVVFLFLFLISKVKLITSQKVYLEIIFYGEILVMENEEKKLNMWYPKEG